MKKISVVLFVLLFVTGALKAQHISLNAYGGYTFDDKSDFTNAYAHINGGFMWGLSVEGISESGGALELLYQHQQTDIPVHASAGDALLNLNNQAANISYLLLNGIKYFTSNPTIEPYLGVGFGAAFLNADATSSSTTKFAWDLKTGIKIAASPSVGIKLGVQLLSSLHYSGTDYYSGYAYETYSNISQWGLTGGLVFNVGH